MKQFSEMINSTWSVDLDEQRIVTAMHFCRVICVFLFFTCLCHKTVYAAHIQVNSELDIDDPASCTLREAVFSINFKTLAPGCQNIGEDFLQDDKISFSEILRGKTITLSQFSFGGNQLVITRNNNLRIDASSIGGITIDGGFSRVISVSDSTLILNYVVITQGSVNGRGAGIESIRSTLKIYNSAFVGNRTSTAITRLRATGGAAIYSQGSEVEIFNSSFSENSSRHPLFVEGGAIYAESSTLKISNSTFDHNTLEGAANGGGAIASVASVITIVNSTFSNNAVIPDGAGVQYFGGESILAHSGALSLEHVTMFNDEDVYESDIEYVPSLLAALGETGLTVKDSLFLATMGRSCSYADASTLGANFSHDGFCGTESNSILVDAVLRDNGCLVDSAFLDGRRCIKTHALMDGSVAIDAAIGSGILDDQRGLRRQPQMADSGAFEVIQISDMDVEEFYLIPVTKQKSILVVL